MKIREKTEKIIKNRAFIRIRDTLAAFLLSAVKVHGVQPFGEAFAAASASDELWRCGGAFLGSLVAGGEYGVLYASAVMICFSCLLVFKNTKIVRQRFFQPAAATVTLAMVKGVTVLIDFSLQKLLLFSVELGMTFGAAFLFGAMARKDAGLAGKGGRALAILLVLSLTEPLRLFGFLSPARVFAAAATVLAAYCCGGTAGAGAGAMLGAVLDLQAQTVPSLCLIYGLGGLMCGAAKGPRLFRAFLWALGSVSAAVWISGGETAAVAAECLLVGLLLAALPEKKMGLLKSRAGTEGRERPVMPQTSGAVERLGREIAGGRRQEGDNTVTALNRAADIVCRSCPRADKCWDSEYTAVNGAFNEIENLLQSKSLLLSGDLPAIFTEKCLRTEMLCAEINRQFVTVRHRQSLLRRQEETDALMKRQYDGISALLRDLSGHTAGAGVCDAADRKIGQVVKTYFPQAAWEAYFEKDRFIVDVYAKRMPEPQDAYSAAGSLRLAVGCDFEPPFKVITARGEALRFCRKEKYAAESAVSVKSKEGERVCGDSIRKLKTGDGRAVVVLSDGMGTGDAAKELSSAATDMIAELASAGASLYAAYAAVLPVLEARFERSGFVTLDMLELDLFSGEASFIKCGAAASYIVRGGREEKIFEQSFPAGLRTQPVVLKVRLKAGDTVVMMTDGVTRKSGFDGTPQEICEKLTDAYAADDMTAVALRLMEA